MSKLDGLKEGDRVRITFEGTVDNFDSSLKVCVCPDNQIGFSWILSDLVTSSPAFQIERIDPPIIVGDFVFDPAAGSRATVVGEIIRNGSRFLWLDGGASGFRTRHEGALTKVSDSERPF